MGVYADLSLFLYIYWPLFFGNMVEWYEFAAYEDLEPYLERKAFKSWHIAACTTLVVSFVARPLGGAMLGAVGDRFGRSFAVKLSMVGMLVGTCGQGMVPTFEHGETWGTVGLASLVVLRCLQGFCAAGEIASIPAYITEVAPRESLGRSISLLCITGNVGFLLAKVATYSVQRGLGEAAMEEWGWRMPFLFAVLPGLIAVWGRSSLPESAAFIRQQEKAKQDSSQAQEARSSEEAVGTELSANTQTPPSAQRESVFAEVMRNAWRNIIVGIGSVVAYAILQYGSLAWKQSYFVQEGVAPEVQIKVALLATMLVILLGPFVGLLSDFKGVGWVQLVGAAFLTITAFPAFALVNGHLANELVVGCALTVGVAVMKVLCHAVLYLFVAELFPVEVRCVGVGIAYNVGVGVFGGLANIVVQATPVTSWYVPGFMFSIGGAITVTAILGGLHMQKQGKMQMAHVRPTPYFGETVSCGGEDSSNWNSDGGVVRKSMSSKRSVF